MRVGFVHGVLNTDNMSILGLTIDYGPYGWIDDYDPDWTPNTTDAQGRRYRFGWQPRVAHWNLSRLAGALSPLFADAAPLQAGLDAYAATWADCERDNACAKLGLEACDDGGLELMRELQAQGCTYHTHCDTETVLKLYERQMSGIWLHILCLHSPLVIKLQHKLPVTMPPFRRSNGVHIMSFPKAVGIPECSYATFSAYSCAG